jgi:hypothetical protein
MDIERRAGRGMKTAATIAEQNGEVKAIDGWR